MLKYLLFLFIYINGFLLCEEKAIFMTSIPKAGTHLLAKCISLLTDKQLIGNWAEVETNGIVNYKKIEELKYSSFFRRHLPFNLSSLEFIKKSNFVSFFILRDPRDQIISSIYWMQKNLQTLSPKNNLNIQDQINNLINSNFINNNCYDYIGWLNEKTVCSIRFENLIGLNGGGTKEKQNNEIKKIIKHLNSFNLKTNSIEYVVKNLWGGTFTFREGRIGAWKSHFTSDHILSFKKKFGQLLIDLNYERDLNW